MAWLWRRIESLTLIFIETNHEIKSITYILSWKVIFIFVNENPSNVKTFEWIENSALGWSTVWSNSTVTFYDGVALKSIKDNSILKKKNIWKVIAWHFLKNHFPRFSTKFWYFFHKTDFMANYAENGHFSLIFSWK